MYSFKKSSVGDFTVYMSVQRKGDIHLKKFSKEVTPQNQSTVNVYVLGEFKLSIDGFNQVVGAGSTTLDLNIAEFPENQVFTEEVLSPVGIRYCVSVQQGSFTRNTVEVTEETPYVSDGVCVAFVLSGMLKLSGASLGSGAYVALGSNSSVTGSGKLLVLKQTEASA